MYRMLILTTLLFVLVVTSAQAADRVDSMRTEQVYDEAQQAIDSGAIYSSRWGGASSYLKRLCYELVERAFHPYGTQEWAVYIVRRESDCNPGAINSSSGTTGIAQIHPVYHRWIDYYRLKRDIRYAVAVFVRMSRGGRSTGPWCLC